MISTRAIFLLTVTVSAMGTSTSFAQCTVHGVPGGFGLNVYESNEGGSENGIIKTFRGTSQRPPFDEVYPTGRTRVASGKSWIQIAWRYPGDLSPHWGWVLKNNVLCTGGSYPTFQFRENPNTPGPQ
jgi:hypothetical protein